jgi:hypothetical protein
VPLGAILVTVVLRFDNRDSAEVAVEFLVRDLKFKTVLSSDNAMGEHMPLVSCFKIS